MPYPSYAKITDDDMRALYDFLMKEVPQVKQANKRETALLWKTARGWVQH
jgi:hypothetical protein